MSDLYMAFNDQETPLGLLMINPDGTFMRSMQQWFPMTPDNQQFDDVEVVQVSDDFLSLFDMLDSKDHLPTYSQAEKFAENDEEDIASE